MLVNGKECWTQVQLRSDQARLVAAMANPSYLTWKGIPHSLGQVLNYLSHHSGWSPGDTPESWDNRLPRLVPTVRDYQGILVVFLPTPVENLQSPRRRSPCFPMQRSPWSPLSPVGGPPGPTASKKEVLQVSLVCLGDLVEAPWSALSPSWRPPGLSGSPSRGPQVHLAIQEVVCRDCLVTNNLKAHLDSHSCGKVVLH